MVWHVRGFACISLRRPPPPSSRRKPIAVGSVECTVNIVRNLLHPAVTKRDQSCFAENHDIVIVGRSCCGGCKTLRKLSLL